MEFHPITVPRSSRSGRGEEGAEGAPGMEVGSDSYTEGRGFPGRDHRTWALKDEWEFTELRCHSSKIEMILVHAAYLCQLGKGTLPPYLYLSENCPNFRKSATSIIWTMSAPRMVHNSDNCTAALGKPSQKGQRAARPMSLERD